MQRHIIAGLLLAALMGTSACSDSAATKADNGLMQISSIDWNEVAAASSAANVNNNGLIMMR